METIHIVILLICCSVALGLGLACLLGFLEIRDSNIRRKNGLEGEKKVTKEIKKALMGRGKIIENPIYLDSTGMSHELDQLVICRKGIFVFETKSLSGKVSGSHDSPTWTQYYNEGGERTFRNPIWQNYNHMRVVHEIIREDQSIFGYVIMTNNNGEEINSSQVVSLSYLQSLLDTFPEIVPTKKVNELYTTLVKARANISHEQHLENIRKHKQGLL